MSVTHVRDKGSIIEVQVDSSNIQICPKLGGFTSINEEGNLYIQNLESSGFAITLLDGYQYEVDGIGSTTNLASIKTTIDTWISDYISGSGSIVGTVTANQGTSGVQSWPVIENNSASINSGIASILSQLQNNNKDFEQTVWVDTNDTFYILNTYRNEQTGTMTYERRLADGSLYTLVGTPSQQIPVGHSIDYEFDHVNYKATANGTGYSIDDYLLRTYVVDASTAPLAPNIVAEFWINETTGLQIAAPTGGHYVPFGLPTSVSNPFALDTTLTSTNTKLDTLNSNITDKSQFTKITDGTETALVTASGELNVLPTPQPGTDIGDVTVNNGAGASAVNIQDGGNSITVDAINLDIRDLTFSSDKVDASGSTVALDASTLTALELVGIKGADGSGIASNANPVPISDAGGSITVDGAVTANAGTDLNTSLLSLEATQQDIKTALQVVDDWDESDRAKVNPIVGQAGVQAGAGAITANTQRVTLASDQPAISTTDTNLKNKIGATATLTNVSGSASSVTLLASNTSRISCVVYNDSVSIMYLKYGSTASSTSFTFKLFPDDAVVIDDYNGILTGIWVSAVGSARVTEVST